MSFFSLFQYYVDGFCRYLGDLEEHLENIPSVGTCQQACQHYTGCKYWVYDEDQMDCELLNSNERICDISRGPPKPSYAECFPPQLWRAHLTQGFSLSKF